MFPDEADFDTTIQTVTFPADEFSPLTSVSATIGVTDDDINEADEQLLVAYLEAVQAVDMSMLDNTEHNTSLCRIVDNDRKYVSTSKRMYM